MRAIGRLNRPVNSALWGWLLVTGVLGCTPNTAGVREGPIAVQDSSAQEGAQGLLRQGQQAGRHLAAPSVHRWTMEVRSGEYVEVDVLQQGIDLVVRLLD